MRPMHPSLCATFLLSLAALGCWTGPVEGRFPCTYPGPVAGECPSGWVCRSDSRCWSTEAPDDAGVDAPSTDDALDAPASPDTPDVGPVDPCGNGVDEGSPWSSERTLPFPFAELIATTELEVLQGNTPTDGALMQPPHFVLAASATEVVVGALLGSNVPELRTLDVGRWGAFPGRIDTTPLLGAEYIWLSLGNGNDGSTLQGMALRLDGSVQAGLMFSITGGNVTVESPLEPSMTPHVVTGLGAHAGGIRPFTSTTTARSIAQETEDATPLFGAVEGNGVAYRTTLRPTGRFHLTAAGSIVLAQPLEGGSPPFYAWDVERTPEFDGTRTDRLQPIDIAAPMGRAAIEEASADRYLVAMPTEMGIELFWFDCTGGPCTAMDTGSRFDVVGVPVVVPSLVRLNRLQNGYVATVLTGGDTGEAEARLFFLNDSAALVGSGTGVIDSAFLSGAPGIDELVDVSTTVFEAPTGLTIVVAGLYRNPGTLEDRVVARALRACASL